MLARSERHKGIDLHHRFARFRGIVEPRGTNDDFAYVKGAEVFFPRFDPRVALHFPQYHFQRSDVYLRVFLEIAERGKNLRFGFRIVRLDVAFAEYFRRLKKFFVYIVPRAALGLGKGDDVVHVGNRHAVLGKLPEDIGNEFAADRRGMHGDFGIFHDFSPVVLSFQSGA